MNLFLTRIYKNKAKMFYTFIPIIILVFVLSACQAEEEEPVKVVETPQPTATAEIVTTPKEGKTVVLSMRLPKTLNPLLNEDATVDRALKLVFEPLVIIDESLKPVPNILESFTFSEDGLSSVLVLKDNLKWHNGESVTADDIAYSIEVIKNSADTAIYKKCVENISIAESWDEKTIKLTYEKASVNNAYDLTFPVISRSYYFNEHDDNIPMGNGAYVFDHYENIREINFKKNTEYFKEVPMIDYAKFVVTTDMEADLGAFREGIINVIVSDIVDAGKIRGARETKTTEFMTTNFDFIGFNFENPALKEANLRKAIASLVDKDTIVKNIYLGHAEKAFTPVNPSSWLYDSRPAKHYYTISGAKKNIEDLGYALNDEAVLVKYANEQEYRLNFRILINEENAEGIKVAELLGTNMKSAGIKYELNVVNFEEYTRRVQAGEFDILIGGFHMSKAPDLSFMLHSSGNIFAYANEVMDAKLQAISGTHDENVLKDNVSDLQFFIAEEVPIISLVYRKSALLLDDKLDGEFHPTQDNVFRNINEWYIYE